MSHIKELNKYIKKNGIVGLLPQNLSDRIIKRFEKEISALDDEDSNIAASTIMLALFSLVNKSNVCKISNKITFEGVDIMNKFNTYVTWINIEIRRRNSTIEIPTEDMPTLNDIFIIDKKVRMAIL